MDLSSVVQTFAIALREGVEAALVVGIVLACLKKAQQSQLNPWVYTGVGAGIFASGFFGFLFSWLMRSLSQSDHVYAPVIKPLLGAFFCLFAIAMLSWMLIWMTQQAKALKFEVEAAVSAALSQTAENLGKVNQFQTAGLGVFSLIFIAVFREGFETVLFILTNTEQSFSSAIGAFAGLIGAVAIGVLLFQWGIKINIRLFFQIMGIVLLLIVAGLAISLLKNLDAAAIALSEIDSNFSNLCFSPGEACLLGPRIWNGTDILPERGFPGILLKALLGYREKLYLAQAIAYLGFLATVGGLYFRSLANSAGKPAPTVSTELKTSED